MFSIMLPMLNYFWLFSCVWLINYLSGGEATAHQQQLAQKPCELAWIYGKLKVTTLP